MHAIEPIPKAKVSVFHFLLVLLPFISPFRFFKIDGFRPDSREIMRSSVWLWGSSEDSVPKCSLGVGVTGAKLLVSSFSLVSP